ncbi:receptor-like protein 9DC3 [Impatiens glandulifera]|uniref:receptor-like protein 9DC3 n=1 Tax=Impatiens glandulifera TaxID=253017 RepID=UPI001FB16F85|nr:receptor-like protein 9DC3 [Impatiens glandulifera]
MKTFLMMWILFIIILQFHQVLSSSSSNHLCPHQHRLILLKFKQMFVIDHKSTDESFCVDGYDNYILSYPKTVSWNESNTNCCSWDGVTCNDLTGDVIGIDLTCSQLSGTFHPNTTLFQLPLTSLNLSYNNFQKSHIPSSIGMLAPTLTHLNISTSNISGPIPSEIAHLSKLVVLRLSEVDYDPYGNVSTHSLRLEQHDFQNIISNLTQLEILDLRYINISSSIIPDFIVNLTSLTSLYFMGNIGLYGQVPDGVFNLPALQKLRIRYNDGLKGSFHNVNWNISGTTPPLKELRLSTISLSGGLPDSIGHLRSLNFLLFDDCNLSGSPPGSIGNLTQLIGLSLSYNNFTGLIPPSLSNLNKLNFLYLSENHFEGSIPVGLFGLPYLDDLRLDNNMLSGALPSIFFNNHSMLSFLDISNNSLSGPIPQSISNLTELRIFYLSYNHFEGSIPVGLFGLPYLDELSLHNNMLSGALPSIFFNNHSMLSYLSISMNNLSGPFPQSISSLTELDGIDLSFNNFDGPIPQFISNLTDLRLFYLNYNNFDGSIPQFISNLTELDEIDLSFNNFDGTLYLDTFSNTKQLRYIKLGNNGNLSVVDADGNFSTITFLDLSSCKLQNFPIKFLTTSKNLRLFDLSNTGVSGQIPEWIGDMSRMRTFRASNNKIKGEIPSSICNMKVLNLLDLSQNELEGPIHPCFGNFSTKLRVQDLRNNNLHGGIPEPYAEDNMLSVLALNGNGLQGPIPESLSLCKHLQVLDIGNNMINGTFPIWVDALPELEVLVLRSNKFHGFLDFSKTPSPFPRLRIFDISHNEFTGPLPSFYFNNFNAMKTVNQNRTNLTTFTNGYEVSVTMTMKGFDARIEGFILRSRTIIDLSSNKFEGAIPDVVGKLFGLTMLNISNNRLNGHIPVKLGNLVQLEHLDLSSNHLTGEIPQELTSLTFLEVLNLSCNGLEGHIPQGKQFNTFSNTSYMENVALCGPPLSRKCQGREIPIPSPNDDSENDDSDYAFMNGFTWQAVLMGYASGMIIGLGGGCLSFYTGRPKWFATMIDEEGYKIIKKYNRRVRRLSSNLRLH